MPKHIYVGPTQRWYEDLPASTVLIAVACLIVLAIIGISAFNCSNGATTQPAEETLSDKDGTLIDKDPAEAASALTLTPTIVDEASGTTDINLFSAIDSSSEVLDSETAAPIQSAIAAFSEQDYETGFVVIDLTTGKGIGYNADASFFAASTIKAPYVNYVFQGLIETGTVFETDYLAKDQFVEGTGIMAEDGEDGYALSEVLNNTITYSDNTGYALLREHYDGLGWPEWVSAAGISGGDTSLEWYPTYSPRMLAQFWIPIVSYLESGTSTAMHFQSLLASTSTSFLRSALAPNATVYAKAGYEVDTDLFDMGALNDAGIVSSPSGDYLIAVMSDVDYDDDWLTDNESLLVNLIQALDAAHAAVLAA